MATASQSKLLKPILPLNVPMRVPNPNSEPRTSSTSNVKISPATMNKSLKNRGNAEHFFPTYSLGDAFQHHTAYKNFSRPDGANGGQEANKDKFPEQIVALSVDSAVADSGGGNLKATNKLFIGDIEKKYFAQTDAPRGLLTAIMTAHDQQCNLVINPDAVWLTILAQFSTYVNKNAKALRGRIVPHEGKKELIAYATGSLTTTDYGILMKCLLGEIKKNIKSSDLADWFRPGFSTTTDRDEVCAAVAAMGSVQEYFSYSISLRGNIPSMTRPGAVADWTILREKIERFLEFEVPDNPEGGVMGLWVGYLRKVCDGFVESAEHPGSAKTREFWDKVAQQRGGGSGPLYITGWISVFTCFDSSGRFIGMRTVDGSEFPLIDTEIACSNVVSCQLKINDHGIEHDGEIFTGQGVFEVEQGLEETYPTIYPRNDWWTVAMVN